MRDCGVPQKSHSSVCYYFNAAHTSSVMMIHLSILFVCLFQETEQQQLGWSFSSLSIKSPPALFPVN